MTDWGMARNREEFLQFRARDVHADMGGALKGMIPYKRAFESAQREIDRALEVLKLHKHRWEGVDVRGQGNHTWVYVPLKKVKCMDCQEVFTLPEEAS